MEVRSPVASSSSSKCRVGRSVEAAPAAPLAPAPPRPPPGAPPGVPPGAPARPAPRAPVVAWGIHKVTNPVRVIRELWAAPTTSSAGTAGATAASAAPAGRTHRNRVQLVAIQLLDKEGLVTGIGLVGIAHPFPVR